MREADDALWQPVSCVIYGGTGANPDPTTTRRSAFELFAGPKLDGTPAVLLVDGSLLSHVDDLRRLPRQVVIVAADAAAAAKLGTRADVSLAGASDGNAHAELLRAACTLARARAATRQVREQLTCAHRDLHELKRVGIALMQEKNHETLLHLIADQGKVLTESDGATLMLKGDGSGEAPFLRVAMIKLDSVPTLSGMIGRGVPADSSSIVGYAAMSGEPMVIDDAYRLPPDANYQRNYDFDQTYGYCTRSMLIVPMMDRNDKAIGVLAFVNRKSNPHARIHNPEDADRWVLPYTSRELRLAQSLASQAAVSIENARLYQQVEHLLESFVKAAATAIDQRDPTTAGHSLRVAALTTDLATALERSGRGAYQNVRFSRAQMRELQFAALLHDFGKVGVKEDVLLKSKKLPPYLWERVNARFDLIRRTKEADHFRERAEGCDGQRRAGPTEPAPSDDLLREQLEELERMRKLIRQANEPDLLPEPPNAELQVIARQTFVRPDGIVAPYLSDVELRFLEIAQGTLDAQERVEIESHVEQTYQFLRQIPWTDDLKNLATYAYGHHEKLNGSGYPRRMKSADIPLQTRLITMADVFDALTEKDRPYRAACSVENALDIMQDEARRGELDPELVRILVESQVYKRVTETDWRGF